MAYLRLYPVVTVKASSSLLFILTVVAWQYCEIICCSNSRRVQQAQSTFHMCLPWHSPERDTFSDMRIPDYITRNLTLVTQFRDLLCF